LLICGDADGAWQWIEDNIHKLPAPIIKSPHLSFAMRGRMIDQRYRVICTSRHVAATTRSMLRYYDSLRIELGEVPYWHKYIRPPFWPRELNHRAYISVWAHFSSAIGWATEVWEYGRWNQWPQTVDFKPEHDIDALFDREVTGSLDETPMWFWQDLNDDLHELWKARHA
jgi:hypothetical protein